MRDRRGLTLVEVIAALALVAVAATAVAFGASSSVKASRLRAGADWTVAVLRQAMRLSWAQQTAVRVQFQPGTMNVTITAWDGTRWAQAHDFFQRWLPGSAPPQGVVVGSTSYPDNTVTITPAGLGLASVEASAYMTEGEVLLGLAGGGPTIRVTTLRDGRILLF